MMRSKGVMRMLEAPKRHPRLVGGRPGRRPDPGTPGRIEQRRRELEPLFAYMKRHHMMALSVVRDACELAGSEPIAVGSVYHIKSGRCVAPEWFVESCCRAMGRTVKEVMGSGSGSDGRAA